MLKLENNFLNFILIYIFFSENTKWCEYGLRVFESMQDTALYKSELRGWLSLFLHVIVLHVPGAQPSPRGARW